MTRRPLPPFGRQFLASKGNAWVALGERAWEIARSKSFPVMVLPPGADPYSYRWPVAGHVVTVIESGSYDTDRLERLALILMTDGARRVIACREALIHDDRVFPLVTYVNDQIPQPYNEVMCDAG